MLLLVFASLCVRACVCVRLFVCLQCPQRDSARVCAEMPKVHYKRSELNAPLCAFCAVFQSAFASNCFCAHLRAR